MDGSPRTLEVLDGAEPLIPVDMPPQCNGHIGLNITENPLDSRQALGLCADIGDIRLQSFHEAVEDESWVPPADAAVRRRVAHVLLLIRPHLRSHLLPILLLFPQSIPDHPLPSVAAHEHDTHLVVPVREREVHLLGAGRVADRYLAGDGDAMLAVRERVAVVVDVVVGVFLRGPAEEAELVGRAEIGEAGERELAGAFAPGGGAVEEEAAEEVEIAGGRRRVDGDIVEAVRVWEVGPADSDLLLCGRRSEGGGRSGLAGGEGCDGEEEERKISFFWVHFAGDAVEKIACDVGSRED
ncbi:hypothetical protein EJB05_52622, partial [Eragrostis curvula]